MQTRLTSATLLSAILALGLLVSGCPKRPVALVAPVPAPAPPPPAAAAPPAPAPAPVAPAPAPAPAPPPAAAAPPAPAPPPAPKEFMANAALADIHFDFDRSAIRRGDAKILDASVAYLKANPDLLVLIEGHCDERGTNEYNLALGERRAKAATSYLVQRGIAADRLTVVSYGEERPVCTEKTAGCWARNRRDHFLTKPR